MYKTASQQPTEPWIQPLDRVAVTFMAVLSVVIVALLWGGHQSLPKVRDFSWQSQVVGADDTAFVLTFTRPMNRQSVEQNLQIGPPLPGRISWAGRRMVYTLNAPAPYGSQYQVSLQNAQEQLIQSGTLGDRMEAFNGQFQTRDRTFAYIGVDGKEDGRLVLYNFTRQKKTVLTPDYLVVQEFQVHPSGESIIFIASDRALRPEEQLYGQKLYRVHTQPTDSAKNAAARTETPVFSEEPTPQPVGTTNATEELLDNRAYLIQRFDLSPDGAKIVVQRVNRKNPSDVGLWLLELGRSPQRLNSQAGGEFQITADSQSIAIAQGEGVSLLPLDPAKLKQLSAGASDADGQFLARFAKVLDFSRDGRYAATIQFNASNYTRSLFVLDAQKGEKEYFKTKGSILQAHFDPTGRYLYCLLAELVPGKVYREQPYLAVVDLKAEKFQPLLLLPEQREMQISLAPDGLALLFDQLMLSETGAQPLPNRAPRLVEGRWVESSFQWLLPLTPTESGKVEVSEPQKLPLLGLRPRWMP